MSKDGTAKIGDFGVARALESTLARAKTYIGTPYYMSPEIYNGEAYTYSTDVWSLGVLLYEMCA